MPHSPSALRRLAAAALVGAAAMLVAPAPSSAQAYGAATPADAAPAAVAPRSIRRPTGLRSRGTLFRPDTPRRRMVRAKRRALAAIRRLDRALDLFRAPPPPGLV